MKALFFGFTLWKTLVADVTPFFGEYECKFIRFISRRNRLKKIIDTSDAIFIWGKNGLDEIEQWAEESNVPLYRVEDGFLRSVGLGSDLTQPYSLVIDARGIYFDPTRESDLEHILEHHRFSDDEIARARRLREYLIEKKISKYNLYENVELDLPTDRQIVVVPGQVEDDASIRFGAPGMTNLGLLEQVRASRPDAYIVFKPHPDVLVGNRAGKVEEGDALRYCDRIVTEVGIDSVLIHAGEVHTMTSLVGFEALMRGIRVVTYGMPFYAGWGLTEDMRTCARRTRILAIEELVAGAYLLYPRYIHPKTLQPCEAEEVLMVLEKERMPYRNKNSVKIRNWISRKSQQVWRTIIN